MEFSITLRHWEKEGKAGTTVIHVEVELSQYLVLVEILPRVTDNVVCHYHYFYSSLC